MTSRGAPVEPGAPHPLPMPTPTHPEQHRRPSRRLWAAIIAVLAVAAAYGLGRLGSEPEPARAALREAPRPAAPDRVASPAPWPRPAVAPAAAPQEGSPVAGEGQAAPPRAPIPPEVMAQYQAEIFTRVEEERPKVVERCWPRDGLPRGQRSASVTYNVSFDAAGREIARGVQSDRRAPAGAFGSCLSRFQGARFTISPPGRPVTLRVAVTYP